MSKVTKTRTTDPTDDLPASNEELIELSDLDNKSDRKRLQDEVFGHNGFSIWPIEFLH